MGHGSGEVRVLVVDDQEPFRRAMAAVVEETPGFVLAGVSSSGEASVVAVGELSPSLVLMDVHMPGMDGTEASRRIRERHPATVVVLLSTYDADEFDGAGSGASAYVPKAVLSSDALTAVWRSATS